MEGFSEFIKLLTLKYKEAENKREFENNFWRELEGKTPVIEQNEALEEMDNVTFIFRSEGTEEIFLSIHF